MGSKIFPSRIHFLLRCVFIGLPLMFAILIIVALLRDPSGRTLPLAYIFLFPVVVVSMVGRVTILVDDQILNIKLPLFGVKIPVADIDVVNDTAANGRMSRLSMNFAQSPGWLEVEYNVRGKTRWATLSPIDKDGFMRYLAEVDPNLVYESHKLQRRAI